MKIDIITIFPEIFRSVFEYGIIERACRNGQAAISIQDLREFTSDRHRTVDDRPFGGGEGMVFKPEPLAAAIRKLRGEPPAGSVIYLSPQGRALSQRTLLELSRRKHLILICGRYEGIDQRIVDRFVDEEISIGDYVLSGGEIPAMVLVDGLVRLLPGTVGHPDSVRRESFADGLLDYPVFTRPEVFEGVPVPEVLMSGDHARIERWRRAQRLEKTRRRRPDLLQIDENIKERGDF